MKRKPTAVAGEPLTVKVGSKWKRPTASRENRSPHLPDDGDVRGPLSSSIQRNRGTIAHGGPRKQDKDKHGTNHLEEHHRTDKKARNPGDELHDLQGKDRDPIKRATDECVKARKNVHRQHDRDLD